jgi:hypothetical protein
LKLRIHSIVTLLWVSSLIAVVLIWRPAACPITLPDRELTPCVRIMLRGGMTQGSFLCERAGQLLLHGSDEVQPLIQACRDTIAHGLQKQFQILKSAESVTA